MSVPVQPGDVIDGVYVVERLLGQGGMGAVFVAREDRLARRVAIKVLLGAVAKNADAVKRFEREARSAAALQSDHVTRVLSVGHLADGAPYIVMELLEGEDLAGVLAARGPLDFAEVVSFMTQVCEALSEAHALGIVHRDLKPANLFLARRPTGATTIKVLDFGISKAATGAVAQGLTATSTMIGTPLYMSPEQLRDVRSVDGRADIWALGVVMYELLSKRLPFLANSLTDLCALIFTATPVPLTAHRFDVPPALDAIVRRCLEKEPAKRFATVQELTVALSQVASALAAPAPPPRGATEVMSPPAAMPASAVAARGRGAPTEGIGQPQPALAPRSDPRLATVPLEPRSDPRLATVPLEPRSDPRLATAPLEHRAITARTVDPVSSTQGFLPPKGPNVLSIGLVFAAALGLGSLAFYALVVHTPAPAVPPAAASGAPSPAPAASSAPPLTTASEQRPVLLPLAPTAATTTSKPAPAVVLPAPGVTEPAKLASPPAATLPPPSAVVVALPPPSAPVALPPPSARVVPNKPPPSSPGSLMPNERN